MELIIDLACETRRYEYFRSDDPVEAARFVVPNAVERLWDRIRHAHGFGRFAVLAANQLVRWESRYGWTRRGWGTVAQQEASLASVLARKLEAPDMWVAAADHYVGALDQAGGISNAISGRETWPSGTVCCWTGYLTTTPLTGLTRWPSTPPSAGRS